MSRTTRIGLSLLALLILLFGLVFLFKGKEIKRLLAVNVLFEEENIVGNFSDMAGLFFHEEMSRGDGPVSPLETVTATLPPLDTWIEERRLTGLVILQDGKLVHEDYFLGTDDDDLRISWSVAKSFLSALTGIALAEGSIESIDVPVTQYAPMLIGSAYDGASLRDVLQMSSGVRFDEDYLDPKSDINRMGRALALGQSMDKFAAKLDLREREPGEHWQYVSIDTHVIGMVIEGATNRRIADLLAEKVIQPLGMESNPVYVTDKGGTAFVLGGLNMPTRDYARFGQMFLQRGHYNGQQIVPEDWVIESTTPSANTPEGEVQYGYQWWIPQDAEGREYFARGIYGQYVYIHEASNVVVAINSADRQFREEGSHEQNLEMFRLIAEALAPVDDTPETTTENGDSLDEDNAVETDEDDALDDAAE